MAASGRRQSPRANPTCRVCGAAFRAAILRKTSKYAGCTALVQAADQGFVEVVRFLVEEGKADVDKVNKKNQTPINIAADKGHLEVVQFLLGKGADCTIKNQWGRAPLATAQKEGHAEVAAALKSHARR